MNRSANQHSIFRFPAWLAAASIVLATVIAYYNAITVPFIFDDVQSITANQTLHHLRDALSPPGGTITVSGRPVLNVSLALNYALGGNAALGYHALNLLIHCLAALTLMGVVRRTLLQPVLRAPFGSTAFPMAWMIAMLWAVHPLQTESVTYVAQRAESLMGLFYLLTLYCFIRAVPLLISNLKSQISNPWVALCIAACMLGMGTKEVMVSAPLMVLLYDRTFVAGSFARALRERWALYAGLAATWLVLAWNFGGQKADINGTVSIWSYALTQCWALAHYLWLSVWPHWLLFDYGTLLVTNPARVVPAALAVLLLAGATTFCLWRRPALGFLGCWFFLILAPTSSVMPLAGQTVAEHRMYLPLAAVITVAVLGFHFLAGYVGLPASPIAKARQPPRSKALASSAGSPAAESPVAMRIEQAVFLLVFLALLLSTIERNQDYRSELALWRDSVIKRPDNHRAQYNLGLSFVQNGQLDEGMVHFRDALALNPNSWFAHNDLGAALLQRGRLDEAIAEFSQALRLKPDFVEALNNLGTARLWSGRADEAAACFQASLRIHPDDADTRDGLGGALRELGRTQEAMAQFQQALDLKPSDANAHNGMAVLLLEQGRPAEAAAHFKKALEFQSQNLAAQNNLAWLLATCPVASVRDGVMAVELAQSAYRLSEGNNPVVLRTLGAAYAETGRFAEAIGAAQRALQLAVAQNNADLVEGLRQQLGFYQAGMPFRDTNQMSNAAH